MDAQLTDRPNLVSDDEGDIVVAVERAFCVKIDNVHSKNMHEVGDLYEFLKARVPHVERSTELPCATASVFRGLRRAVRSRRAGFAIRPDTPVNTIAPILERKDWGEYLRTTLDLDIPGPWLPGWPLFLYVLAALLIFIHATVSAGVFGATMAALAIWLFGAGLVRVRRWPAAMTFGDLARATVVWNIGRIARARGAVRTDEVWQALVHILAEFSPGSTNIGPKTRFFPKT